MIWGRGRAITGEVIDRVNALRAKGLTQVEACRCVGITEGGLTKAIFRRRTGEHQGVAEKSIATVEALHRAVADGVWDVASLVSALGTNWMAVSRAMIREGLKERDLLDAAISCRRRRFPGYTRRQMEDDLRAEALSRKRSRIAVRAMKRAAAAREQVREQTREAA